MICRDAGYRIFFVGHSLLSFAGLLAYGTRLPTHTLYHVKGGPAVLLRLGQAAGIAQLVLGLREVGFLRWAGVRNLQAWRRGMAVPKGPAAQGPEMTEEGKLTTDGPFRRSRHPLNFAGIPIFWLTPHMTTRRLAFNLASSLYLALGSRHEEARLADAYGAAYQAYLDQRVSFFWPDVVQYLNH
jgi:methanethiol S-methyltransferase